MTFFILIVSEEVLPTESKALKQHKKNQLAQVRLWKKWGLRFGIPRIFAAEQGLSWAKCCRLKGITKRKWVMNVAENPDFRAVLSQTQTGDCWVISKTQVAMAFSGLGLGDGCALLSLAPGVLVQVSGSDKPVVHAVFPTCFAEPQK
ncbi:MAG: hypothetical protein AB7F28_02615 [Candidatus Margulisiibacteriota bacterium]